jgi:hypothetical protein
MELIFEACLWLSRRLTGQRRDGPGMPGWQRRDHVRGVLALRLFFALVVGVPVLIVAWGYATGRLPAPSPYVD